MLNKKAIITGGGKGLGRACAIALAKEGVIVGITGRNEASLKDVVSEIISAGGKAEYAVFDVSKKEEVKIGITQLIEKLSGVDILINNAGIAAFGSFMDMEEEVWESIIQTNVMGMYYVTKAVLPHLIAQNEGDVINVSSTAGLAGNPTTSAYSASKFAVIGLSEALMKEVRKNNIRVSTLTPSTIASDMSKELGLISGNSDNVLQPEDFAELVTDILKFPRRVLIKSASIWSTNP